MNQRITGIMGESAGFSVHFPNGLDGEPDVKITGLKVDCDGDSALYGCLMACSNWIASHVDELKKPPQVIYNTVDFTDQSGLANCQLSGGKIKKLDTPKPTKVDALTERAKELESMLELMLADYQCTASVCEQEGYSTDYNDIAPKVKELLDKANEQS